MATVLSETKIATTTNTTINGVAFRYTTVAWPTSGYHVLTVNYYDDYNFPNAPIIPSAVETQAVYYNGTVKPKGLSTGSWVRVPETSALFKSETSYTLYDYKARVIRSYTQNHLGGYTYTDNKLNTFTGQVAYTMTRHKRLIGDAELLTKEAFTYSDQDRLMTHTHQINGGEIQLLASNSYDALGQLTSKGVGNTAVYPLQKVDYAYNIRGWLTEINKVATLQQVSGPKDLFAFKLNYNAVEDCTGYTGTKLYNGNISESYWTAGSDNVQRKYGYSYDQLNRLKTAVYQKPGMTPAQTQVTNMYNESLTYDKNGNILSLNRTGDTDAAIGTILIDNLSYAYTLNSNKLLSVTDSSNNISGFSDDNSTGDDYTYDANGNLITDKNKNITSITYNHLNLPAIITFGTTGTIEYLYNANGVKVQKRFVLPPQNSSTITTTTITDYLTGFQYNTVLKSSPIMRFTEPITLLQFFPTAEGYYDFVKKGYVFNYKDHLGNVRLGYSDTDKSGTIVASEILDESHYYPFGLKHVGYITALGTDYKYKYNGKELQDDNIGGVQLNWYDYGARNYDPALGRWMNIDPLAETSRRFSPYTYALNNPVYFIDPDGMEADDWINFTGKNGQQQIIYDSSVKTKAQAEAKGYANVNQVFEAGTGKSEKTGEVVDFQKDGTFSVNGGKPMDVDDTSYTTKGGTYIGENKGVIDAIGDFGPGALQKGGDAMTKGAGVAALSGAEPVAAGLATVGGTMSAIGAGGAILNDAVEGKFDLKNAAIQAGSFFLNKYLKGISGDDSVKKIMFENGVNEVGKGMEELNKK
nr:RHS repeat-associated core domain-containing protein [uncultured Flavobacterium sp.]